jgi:hypothetical protein
MPVDFQKVLANNMMNVFNSLSFYSPLIILSSIFIFSMFTATISKFGWYFLWFFTISCIRYFMYSASPIPDVSPICDTFIPLDYTYSTYVLTFTMTYFVMPMVLISKQNNINAMNYGVLALFISYIVLDLFIKHSLQCIPTIFSSLVIGNLLGGLLCGVIAVMVMYGSTLKNYLYINEVNTNKEVCSMPSKQQFKCRVFKDGTLIGDI